MKKFTIVIFLALLLTACQPEQVFRPSLTPNSTETQIPIVTATLLPTPTYTPTLVIENILVGGPSNNKSYIEGLVLSELSYVEIDPKSFGLINPGYNLVTGEEGGKVLVDHFLDPQNGNIWKGAGISEKTTEAIFHLKTDRAVGQTKGTSKWGTVIRLDLFSYLLEDGRKLIAITNKGFPVLFEQDGKLMFGAIGEDYRLDKDSIRPAFESLNETISRLVVLGYSGNVNDIVNLILEKSANGLLTGRIQVMEVKGIRYLRFIGTKPNEWQTPFYNDLESLSNDLEGWLEQGVCNTPYNEIRFIDYSSHRGYLYKDYHLIEMNNVGAGGISLTIAPRFFGFLRPGDGMQYAVLEACDVNNRPFVWIGAMGLVGDPDISINQDFYRSVIQEFDFNGKIIEGGLERSIAKESNDAVITKIRPGGQIFTHVDGFDSERFEFSPDRNPKEIAYLKLHMPREYVINISNAYSGLRTEEAGAVAWTVNDLVNLNLNQTPFLGDISYSDK